MHAPHVFRVREFSPSLDPGALAICEALENAAVLPADVAQCFGEYHGSQPRHQLSARAVVEALVGHYLAEAYNRNPQEFNRFFGFAPPR